MNKSSDCGKSRCINDLESCSCLKELLLECKNDFHSRLSASMKSKCGPVLPFTSNAVSEPEFEISTQVDGFQDEWTKFLLTNNPQDLLPITKGSFAHDKKVKVALHDALSGKIKHDNVGGRNRNRDHLIYQSIETIMRGKKLSLTKAADLFDETVKNYHEDNRTTQNAYNRGKKLFNSQ